MKIKKIITISILMIFIVSCSVPSFLSSFFTNQDTEDQEVIQGNTNDFQVASPTPEPPLLPEQRIELADYYLFAGDLENARSEYQRAYDESNDNEKKALALYGIGKVYMADSNYAFAVDSFTHILGQFSDTTIVPNTYFLLGISYEKIEEYSQASNAYAQFHSLKPGIIDADVLTRKAAAASNAGDHNAAIFAYQSALQTNPAPDAAQINLKIGQEYSYLEDYTTAIQFFLNAYDTAINDYQKSTANLLAGQAYLEVGQTDMAYNRFLDSVFKFPRPFDTFTALSILVNAGYPVDDYMRGVVDYYVGSYDFAILAFERFLANNPSHDGTVHYFKGLCHYYSGEYLQAIDEYQSLIDNYPTNTFWDDAWEEIAFIYWNTPGDSFADIGDYQASVNTRLSFVASSPQSSVAPQFLYLAARALEYNDQLEEAAQIWTRMMDEYPAHESSYKALFLSGISYFRLERYEEALNVFQRCLGFAAISEERASSYLWIGKSYEKLEQSQNAVSAWQQAEAADPTDYYGIRAGDLLNDHQTLDISTSYEFGYDLGLEKDEAESWMRTTFSIPQEVSLIGLGSLNGDQRIQKGQLYWEFGLYDDAISEFDAVKSEVFPDPLLSYLLMNYLYELGFYKPAIELCANLLLNLAGLDELSSLAAPIYFTHIRFGAYFRNYVVDAANSENINPLILFSLLRQESLFEPFISSAVGAQGIAQIMPATGKDIVDRINWPPNYQTQDLLLARIGIILGASYLRQQYEFLDEDLLAALAAYNGGPGNSLSWKNLAKGDPDLFLEVIRFNETQHYLRQIIEFTNIYELVYTRP